MNYPLQCINREYTSTIRGKPWPKLNQGPNIIWDCLEIFYKPGLIKYHTLMPKILKTGSPAVFFKCSRKFCRMQSIHSQSLYIRVYYSYSWMTPWPAFTIFSLFIPAVFFKCSRMFCRMQSIHSQSLYIHVYKEIGCVLTASYKTS